MARELEPPRRPAPRPRGCLAAYVVAVLVLLAVLVALAVAFQPRYPGADPF